MPPFPYRCLGEDPGPFNWPRMGLSSRALGWVDPLWGADSAVAPALTPTPSLCSEPVGTHCPHCVPVTLHLLEPLPLAGEPCPREGAG